MSDYGGGRFHGWVGLGCSRRQSDRGLGQVRHGRRDMVCFELKKISNYLGKFLEV